MNRAITAETSRAIAVLEKLREDITNCVYESGQFITESEISHKFNVSKTPAREALNCLCQEGLLVKTLYYHDEIAAVPKQIPKVSPDKNELEMAKMLVENMTKPFHAEDFRDEYQARLREAVMKKIQGKEIVSADAEAPGNVIDLMEALQKSLEMSGGKGRKKAGTA